MPKLKTRIQRLEQRERATETPTGAAVGRLTVRLDFEAVRRRLEEAGVKPLPEEERERIDRRVREWFARSHSAPRRKE